MKIQNDRDIENQIEAIAKVLEQHHVKFEKYESEDGTYYELEDANNLKKLAGWIWSAVDEVREKTEFEGSEVTEAMKQALDYTFERFRSDLISSTHNQLQKRRK